jgi:hypothetical protein
MPQPPNPIQARLHIHNLKESDDSLRRNKIKRKKSTRKNTLEREIYILGEINLKEEMNFD